MLRWLASWGRTPAVAAVLRYVASLRPAWWAARGCLVVAAVLAATTQGGGYRLHTAGSYRQSFDGPAGHQSPLWLLVPAAAVLASVAVGQLTPRLALPARLLVLGLDAVAVFVLLAYPTWWLGPAFGSFTGLVG